jgi:hypothetical protein
LGYRWQKADYNKVYIKGGNQMYTLFFSCDNDTDTTMNFVDCSDAVNAAVHLQYMAGGYNTSNCWHYEVINEEGRVVYEDECMRHFE